MCGNMSINSVGLLQCFNLSLPTILNPCTFARERGWVGGGLQYVWQWMPWGQVAIVYCH